MTEIPQIRTIVAKDYKKPTSCSDPQLYRQINSTTMFVISALTSKGLRIYEICNFTRSIKPYLFKLWLQNSFIEKIYEEFVTPNKSLFEPIRHK